MVTEISLTRGGAHGVGGWIGVELVFDFVVEDKDVAGLATEGGADGFECGKADGARFSGLKDGEVGERDVDGLG